ncbi:DNA translocase FtsK [Haemophilus sp. UMB1048]|uniref:DNA translocase FtsK n=1 Tax=Haemophilus sp. UMB1048 TaxID=3046322 RepID=UPI002553434F|nr:DNA translocase FtsK [Haemophilus sp. UMB1048]MDK7254049.1 DNA translocase FtsK [Haemophilus sp. UMB1048]
MAMKVTFKREPLFEDVKKFVQQQKFASCSMIQRKFSLGFNRAGRIVEQLEEAGIISPMKNGQRKVL